MTGKGSLNHNSRKFHAKNTDPNRTHWNVEYCNEDIKDVYHELFDEALKRYNDKQTRKDRKIDDYYEKIRSGKQEKLFHEVIIQIGDKDNMGSEMMEGQLAAKILDEYMKGFQERNPALRVFAAHLHMDETTPYLHVDFVPYTTGSKRGLDTRVSLKQALSALGFKGGTRIETELNQWVAAEKQQLASIMLDHGIEWEQKGTHEKYLSLLDFEKQEHAKEVAALEVQKADLEEHNATMQEVKRADLLKKKETFACNSDIQKIVDYYSEKPTDFEGLCSELFESLGYIAKLTPPTNDGGYDILLTRGGEKTIVECKCYSIGHKVGRPNIQKLVGANNVVLADKMIFITTSDFSGAAISYAEEVEVKLINGNKLMELLHKQGFIEKEKVKINVMECQLETADLYPYVPRDIYESFFE